VFLYRLYIFCHVVYIYPFCYACLFLCKYQRPDNFQSSIYMFDFDWSIVYLPFFILTCTFLSPNCQSRFCLLIFLKAHYGFLSRRQYIFKGLVEYSFICSCIPKTVLWSYVGVSNFSGVGDQFPIHTRHKISVWRSTPPTR